MAAGEETAGHGRSKKHPDWFVEASDTLQPLIDAKNAALNQFLQKQIAPAKRSLEDANGLFRVPLMMPRSSGSTKWQMKLRKLERIGVRDGHA